MLAYFGDSPPHLGRKISSSPTVEHKLTGTGDDEDDSSIIMVNPFKSRDSSCNLFGETTQNNETGKMLSDDKVVLRVTSLQTEDAEMEDHSSENSYESSQFGEC